MAVAHPVTVAPLVLLYLYAPVWKNINTHLDYTIKGELKTLVYNVLYKAAKKLKLIKIEIYFNKSAYLLFYISGIEDSFRFNFITTNLTWTPGLMDNRTFEYQTHANAFCNHVRIIN